MTRVPVRLGGIVARLALAGFVTLGAGCMEGSVGGLCGTDSDCDHGLQCFKPAADQQPVCTIGCESGACDQGSCVVTAHGALCATPCIIQEDCPGELACQAAPEGNVCWYPDPNLEPLPDGIALDHAELVGDTNGDGVLNAGESATLRIYAVNVGIGAVAGLWSKLVSADPAVQVQGCTQTAYPTSFSCSAVCSCEGLDPAKRMTLSAGQSSADPILEINFTLDGNAAVGPIAFAVSVTDDQGTTWQESITVQVEASQANVVVVQTVLLDDSNGDGYLSPGEDGEVAIYVQNQGTTNIEGLWAALVSSDSFASGPSCAVGMGSSWASCDVMCSCEQVGDAGKPSLAPNQITTDALFKVAFHVSPDAPYGPATFHMAFHDAMGSTWLGSFSVDIQPAGALLALSHVEILDDANGDGYVSPAESASVQVFVGNVGTSKAVDVWAELTSSDPMVDVHKCSVGVGATWVDCDEGCSCENALESAKQSLAPGEIGEVAVLVVQFQVDPEAPISPIDFDVAFHDGLGNRWDDSFSMPVQATQAVIEVGSSVLLDDANGDGFLSPAETATLEIFPVNTGTSGALGVWAELSTVDPLVEVLTCYTSTASQWVKCDANCACGEVPEEDKKTLDAQGGSDKAILQVNFVVSAEAPLGPLAFGVSFHDLFGNTWTDTITIDVVGVKADIKVAGVEVWGDSDGDGLLTPGETAKVQIFAKNEGTSKTFGVYAELADSDEYVDVSSCYAEVGAAWSKCNAACSCETVADLAKQSLGPGETGTDAILRLNFDLKIDAPIEPLAFDVIFHDMFGNQWQDSFSVEVDGTKGGG